MTSDFTLDDMQERMCFSILSGRRVGRQPAILLNKSDKFLEFVTVNPLLPGVKCHDDEDASGDELDNVRLDGCAELFPGIKRQYDTNESFGFAKAGSLLQFSTELLQSGSVSIDPLFVSSETLSKVMDRFDEQCDPVVFDRRPSQTHWL